MRSQIVSALLLGSIFSVSACPGGGNADAPLDRRSVRAAGVVVDETGAPRAGVLVRVGNASTTTDGAGRFVLEGLSEGSTMFEVAGRVSTALLPADDLVLRSNAATEVVFSGDVMFARRYLDPRADGSGNGALAAPNDPSSFVKLVAHVAPLTVSADLALPNVETPFGWGGDAHPSKPFVFISPPASVAALHALGADVALLANNHTYDFFDPGLRSTLEVLHGAGLVTVGAGMNEGEAYRPLVVTHGAFRLGVAPFCGLRICGVPAGDGTQPDEPPYQNAIGEKGGVAKLSDDKLVAAFDALRGKVDRTVVVLHSGNEYQPTPSDGQRRAAHRAIDLGADLVVGHHPHVLQPLEVYAGHLVAYSLGNLLFDQDFRETWSGALLRVSMAASPSYRLDPIFLDDYVPFAATGRLARFILRDLGERSAPFGATIRDDGRVMLSPPGLDESSATVSALADRDRHGATASLEAFTTRDRYVTTIAGATAVGRDVLAVGSFEHDLVDAPWERAFGWNVVSASQKLTSDAPRDGSRALRLCRDVTSASGTGLASAGRHRITGASQSLCGCVRGHAMSRAKASIQYFADVAADAMPLATVAAFEGAPDAAWSCFCAEATPPAGAQFVALRLEVNDQTTSNGCSGPDDALHCVDFDALRLIEWSPYDGSRLPVPNAVDFARTAAPGDVSVTVAKMLEGS